MKHAHECLGRWNKIVSIIGSRAVKFFFDVVFPCGVDLICFSLNSFLQVATGTFDRVPRHQEAAPQREDAASTACTLRVACSAWT